MTQENHAIIATAGDSLRTSFEAPTFSLSNAPTKSAAAIGTNGVWRQISIGQKECP